jgi:hypothetical protein
MHKCRVIILLLSLIALGAYSQSEDFRTWWAAELRGELFNTVDYKLSPEVRFMDNSTRLSSVITDLDLSYPFFKYLRLGGQYRFEKVQVKNEYLINRFGIYLKARYKIDRFRLGYRAMYHWELIGVNTREIGEIPKEYHRHKFSLGYYKKKWDLRPQASIEYFFNRKPVESAYEQKLRLSAGLYYRINKKISLSVDYKYQKECFVNRPLTAYIIASKITYRL